MNLLSIFTGLAIGAPMGWMACARIIDVGRRMEIGRIAREELQNIRAVEQEAAMMAEHITLPESTGTLP